jgi:hypothetical protein
VTGLRKLMDLKTASPDLRFRVSRCGIVNEGLNEKDLNIRELLPAPRRQPGVRRRKLKLSIRSTASRPSAAVAVT